MKNDQIDLAIAELLGKQVCHGCLNEVDFDMCHCGTAYTSHVATECSHGFVPAGCTCGYAEQTPGLWHGIPRYHADLNAMHEAEVGLLPSESKSYATVLLAIVHKTTDRDYLLCEWRNDHWLTAHATALQRAEAFLRIHGKWKK